METALYTDLAYKVANISLADFGRKEIEIAENLKRKLKMKNFSLLVFHFSLSQNSLFSFTQFFI